MTLLVFIVIYFLGKLLAHLVNRATGKPVVRSLRAAGLCTMVLAGALWWMVVVGSAASMSARQVGYVFGQAIAGPLLVVSLGIAITRWLGGRKGKTGAAESESDPILKPGSKIALIALCVIVAGVVIFGLQVYKASGKPYVAAGFPDAKSYDAYLAEWSKASSTPEFREFASKLSGPESYSVSATLTADGLERLPAADLIDRGKLYLAVMRTQEASFCAQLVAGMPTNSSDDGYARKLLAAIYKAGGEQGMATWGRLSAHAALASLHQDPKPQFSSQEAKEILSEVTHPMSSQERKMVMVLLTQPAMLSDRQKCNAGIALYKSALSLPQQKMESAMQLLVAD
jgi:hypothetical protein